MTLGVVHIAADHQGAGCLGNIKRVVHEIFPDVRVEETWKSFPNDDYPLVVHSIAERMRENATGSFAIIVCGSGIGVCMAANRYQWLRAVTCGTTVEAKQARLHEDANVLCLSSWWNLECRSGEEGEGVDRGGVIRAFLETPFEGGRHRRRIYQMSYLSLACESCVNLMYFHYTTCHTPLMSTQ